MSATVGGAHFLHANKVMTVAIPPLSMEVGKYSEGW